MLIFLSFFFETRIFARRAYDVLVGSIGYTYDYVTASALLEWDRAGVIGCVGCGVVGFYTCFFAIASVREGMWLAGLKF